MPPPPEEEVREWWWLLAVAVSVGVEFGYGGGMKADEAGCGGVAVLEGGVRWEGGNDGRVVYWDGDGARYGYEYG